MTCTFFKIFNGHFCTYESIASSLNIKSNFLTIQPEYQIKVPKQMLYAFPLIGLMSQPKGSTCFYRYVTYYIHMESNSNKSSA